MFTLLFIFIGSLFWIAYSVENSIENAHNIPSYRLRQFWKNSFNFKGITNRSDFWITQIWLLIQIILSVIFGICFSMDESLYNRGWIDMNRDIKPFILFPIYILSIISLIQSISLQVRRLRDAAKNPWWILISFVPLIGTITLLIFYASPSREKRLPITLQDRLNNVEDLLNQGTIDEEEYKYMRKKILTKYVD